MNTPWGRSQSVETYAVNGGRVYWVSTASHGGYLVPKSIAASMPEHLKRIGFEWQHYFAYEEDCAAAAVELSFPEIIKQLAIVKAGSISQKEIEQTDVQILLRCYKINPFTGEALSNN